MTSSNVRSSTFFYDSSDTNTTALLTDSINPPKTENSTFLYWNLSPLLIIGAVIALILFCAGCSAYIKSFDGDKRRPFLAHFYRCCPIRKRRPQLYDDDEALTQHEV